MQITCVRIENFRSIRQLTVELGKSTVFVGPNNSGKTAILDAIRLAMPQRWGQRSTGFNEYDIHLSTDSSDPKLSNGVCIELTCAERESGEWPQIIVDDLSEILQLSTGTDRYSITLRTQFAWRKDNGAFETMREFLDSKRNALTGTGARRAYIDRFSRYLPVFYLTALRDAGDEFASRDSQFWRRLLKALEIPESLESDVLKTLDQLNQRLLTADQRLERIANTLSSAAKVAAHGKEGMVDLRMFPLKVWDLLSRTEIILRNERIRLSYQFSVRDRVSRASW